MLAWMQDFYRIDARAKNVAERGQLRAIESRAVTEKIKTWMQHAAVLKTTSLGGATRYTLGIWDRLTPFLDHSEIWLDNNPTERGIRGPDARAQQSRSAVLPRTDFGARLAAA
jgi:hypothetical protein